MKKDENEAPQKTNAERIALSRKQFLQRAGIAGAGAMLGAASTRADAAPNEPTRLAQRNAAPQNAAPRADASTRGAMVLGETNVRDFGARGDGKTDDTKAFQDAINEASTRGGGSIFVPPGRYLIASHLTLAAHVILRGVSQAPDLLDSAAESVLLAVEGKGNAKGTPFIFMNRASVLKGITITYPEQVQPVPVAYPWTVRGSGDNIAIIDCLFHNPYQAVDFGTNLCGRHYIRNLFGQPLYRGIWVDYCLDVGRFENVHFWPFWSADQKLLDWMLENAIAFQFGRTDWQYLVNCFSIFYNIGFHFADFGNGGGNVLLTNSGSDGAKITAQIDATQSHSGLAFVNAQMNGSLRVADSNVGPIKFTNSSFYGSGKTDISAIVEGVGRVTFDNCHFTGWNQNNDDSPALHAKSGHLGVSNCEFFGAKNHIVLEPNVRTAILMGNLFRGATRITNRSKGRVQLIGNLDTAPAPPKTLRRSFYSGFEATEPQPQLNKLSLASHAEVFSLAVRPGGRSGNALFITGKESNAAAGRAIVYFNIFETSVAVKANTVLRYWLLAENAGSRASAVNLVFDDGTTLFSTNARDLEDTGMHPANGRGEIGKWTRVEIPIGQWSAGRTVKTIQFARDGNGNEPFRTAIDDLEIGESQS